MRRSLEQLLWSLYNDVNSVCVMQAYRAVVERRHSFAVYEALSLHLCCADALPLQH